MNCDNQEFMFSRDLVGCIVRKLSPHWYEPDFEYGENEYSPFNSRIREAAEYIAEQKCDDALSILERELKGKPLTMNTFQVLINGAHRGLLRNHDANMEHIIMFCLSRAICANFFFRNGVWNACSLVADSISSLIFDLRQVGTFNNSFWTDFESAILDLKLKVKCEKQLNENSS